MSAIKLDEEEIVEESVFGNTQFEEMIEWVKERANFELQCKVTGKWTQTGDYFKGEGKLLKRYNGNIFETGLYVLINEGNLGKEDILIGRRIIEIFPKKAIQPFEGLKGSLSKKKPGREVGEYESIDPNVFVIENGFKKDIQNQVFFRNSEYDRALSYLSSFTKKYEVSCHIEGILISEERQIPCIITGTIKSVTDKEIFIQLWDAFDPSDPLNDETKEWLSRDWIIQVAQAGLNKVHPRYMLFEIGEELALTKNVLNVENVKVVLGGRTIIHDVNFNVQKGEILGIIGESGAGKSTTLKAILGEFDYTGNIHVFGMDAHNTKGIAPFIGYVPQDLSRMYGNFNCLENIVAFGRQFGVPDDILIQRGKKILKDLGIDHVANQNVESLSGGQKRRASIAISMVHNPNLIFLDEPTSGLDPLARYELWDYLDIINKEYGITLVVISHYLDEIEYCDKSAIFLRGVGFYDFNTPDGLKQTLPGKGLALEVTLEEVLVEAVDILRKMDGVSFVIQRGERIRLLSKLPSRLLASKVMQTLEQNKIPVHSIEMKVEIDMIDYFTFVSSQHLSGEMTEEELRGLAKSQSNQADIDRAIGYIPGMDIGVSVHSDAKQNVVDMSKTSAASPIQNSLKENISQPEALVEKTKIESRPDQLKIEFENIKEGFTKYLRELQKERANWSIFQLVEIFITVSTAFHLNTDEYNYYLEKYDGTNPSQHDLAPDKIKEYRKKLVARFESITNMKFDPDSSKMRGKIYDTFKSEIESKATQIVSFPQDGSGENVKQKKKSKQMDYDLENMLKDLELK